MPPSRTDSHQILSGFQIKPGMTGRLTPIDSSSIFTKEVLNFINPEGIGLLKRRFRACIDLFHAQTGEIGLMLWCASQQSQCVHGNKSSGARIRNNRQHQPCDAKETGTQKNHL